MNTSTKLFSTTKAAEKLGVSAAHVRHLIAQHGVGQRLGRDWFLTENDFELLNQRRQITGPVPKRYTKDASKGQST